jgi:O-antigen/teichoic acid export membrane protein
MHLLYRGIFDDVSPLLASFAILPVIMGIGNSLNVALKSIERPDLVFRSYVASGVTTVLLGIPLVRHFGLLGAVLGMLGSAFVYTSAMVVGLVGSSRAMTPNIVVQ